MAMGHARRTPLTAAHTAHHGRHLAGLNLEAGELQAEVLLAAGVRQHGVLLQVVQPPTEQQTPVSNEHPASRSSSCSGIGFCLTLTTPRAKVWNRHWHGTLPFHAVAPQKGKRIEVAPNSVPRKLPLTKRASTALLLGGSSCSSSSRYFCRRCSDAMASARTRTHHQPGHGVWTDGHGAVPLQARNMQAGSFASKPCTLTTRLRNQKPTAHQRSPSALWAAPPAGSAWC